MVKKQLLILSLVLSALVVWVVSIFAQAMPVHEEKVTIITYYPAPIGVYNRLATKTLGVGDTNNDSNIDINDTPNPSHREGEVWIDGDVGIGKTYPSAVLDIARNMTAGVNTLNIQNGPNGEIQFSGTNYATNVYSDYAFYLGTEKAHDLTFRTDGKNRMVISGKNNGAIAVGTNFVNGLYGGTYAFPNGGGLLVDGLTSLGYIHSSGYTSGARLIINGATYVYDGTSDSQVLILK